MRLPDPLRSRIVLVGASTYTDPDLPDLPAVRRTVADLATLFTDPDHGVVPEEHCTVLLDDADLGRVGRQLREAARAAEDLLLVYFTGHGLVGGRRHDLYLALPDSEYGDPDFTSIEYDKLRGTVLNSRATTKIIVLDCCFSGRAVTGTMAGGTGTINQLEVSGTYVLTSAQRDQVSLSPPGEDHTAFSGRLIRLLREGIAGGPEYLTIDDLYQRLVSLMVAEGLPVPLNSTTESANLIALGHNRIYADNVAPALRERQVAAEQSRPWRATGPAPPPPSKEYWRSRPASSAPNTRTPCAVAAPTPTASAAPATRPKPPACCGPSPPPTPACSARTTRKPCTPASSSPSTSARPATGRRPSPSYGSSSPTAAASSAANTRTPCGPGTCWPGTSR
nr:caspase family protein [Kitasatospora sp. MBT66]